MMPRAYLNGLLLLVFLLPAGETPATPQLHDCPSDTVRVRAAERADALLACAGALDAIGFFEALGLPPPEPLVVEVVSDLPLDAGRTAAGCYLEEARRILILPYTDFARLETWFRLPVEPALYRSLATHEVAHALAACHFRIPGPTLQAKEYVAYVTTFAVMEPALRARVLAANPGTGFSSERRINEIFYLFDPMRFGAEAYRHYLRKENGTPFLREVLAGRALAP